MSAPQSSPSGRTGAVMGWRMRKIPYKDMFDMVKNVTPQAWFTLPKLIP
jgi:hypothetical protein